MCPFRESQSLSRHSTESVSGSRSHPQPLWKSTNVSILLQGCSLRSPPERLQTLSQKNNLPRPVLFFFNKERKTFLQAQLIAKEIFQGGKKHLLVKHKCKEPHFRCEDKEEALGRAL